MPVGANTRQHPAGNKMAPGRVSLLPSDTSDERTEGLLKSFHKLIKYRKKSVFKEFKQQIYLGEKDLYCIKKRGVMPVVMLKEEF